MTDYDRLLVGFFSRMIGLWLIGYCLVGLVHSWALLALPLGLLWGKVWLDKQ